MNVRNKKPNIVGAQNSYPWYDERERVRVRERDDEEVKEGESVHVIVRETCTR